MFNKYFIGSFFSSKTDTWPGGDNTTGRVLVLYLALLGTNLIRLPEISAFDSLSAQPEESRSTTRCGPETLKI